MKLYFIRYPRNFANEFSLAWIDSDDKTMIEKAISHGYGQITRKEAYRKAQAEKYARRVDPAFSGYGDIIITPYFAVGGSVYDYNGTRPVLWATDRRNGKMIKLYTKDGILFDT